MAIGGRMDQQNVVSPYRRRHQKSGSTDTCYLKIQWMEHENTMVSENKPDTESHILTHCIYMKLSE